MGDTMINTLDILEMSSKVVGSYASINYEELLLTTAMLSFKVKIMFQIHKRSQEVCTSYNMEMYKSFIYGKPLYLTISTDRVIVKIFF